MRDRTDSVIRSAWVISALTLLSRMLGLARDCACAAVFGAGVVWDAFSFAFRIPNLFRMLFGEGALSAAFVPVFTECLERQDKEEAWCLAGRVATALTLALAVLLFAGEAAVLAVLRWLGLSARWQLALWLTAIMLPHMLFVCLTAFAGAALNSLRHFAAPAFAPVLLNVCWIAGVICGALASSDAQVRIFIVAGAILIAGALELGLQLLVLRFKDFRWRLSLALGHPDVHKVAAAMGPVTLGMIALQANLLLDGVMAISLAAPPGRHAFALLGLSIPYPMEVGANSVLYYANRLMQLPLGVFGIAVATAVFPALSRHAARADWRAFSESFTQSLGAVIFVSVPAGVGLILLRQPIIEAVLERGAFTASMTARTARSLFGYSTAIWAYCALHVLTRAFYSLKQPGTPAKVAASMVGLNVVLNLALAWPLKEAGLAAATAVSAVIQVGLLYVLLARRVPLDAEGVILTTVLKTIIATSCMAVACTATLRLLPSAPASGALSLRLARACLPAATGGLAYVAGAALLGSEELQTLMRQVRRRAAEV